MSQLRQHEVGASANSLPPLEPIAQSSLIYGNDNHEWSRKTKEKRNWGSPLRNSLSLTHTQLSETHYFLPLGVGNEALFFSISLPPNVSQPKQDDKDPYYNLQECDIVPRWTRKMHQCSHLHVAMQFFLTSPTLSSRLITLEKLDHKNNFDSRGKIQIDMKDGCRIFSDQEDIDGGREDFVAARKELFKRF